MVETVVCDDDKMCSSLDSVHVFIVLNRNKGRLDGFLKIVMVCLPKFGGAHGLVEVYVHVSVVWVVASMTTGSLIKVCRRASCHNGIIFIHTISNIIAVCTTTTFDLYTKAKP